jgi:hypothetical protein
MLESLDNGLYSFDIIVISQGIMGCIPDENGNYPSRSVSELYVNTVYYVSANY